MDDHPHSDGRRLTLIGGGGHALVVAEAARLAGWRVVGFYDDNERAALGEAGSGGRAPTAAWLGGLREAAAIDARGWILALGDLALRRRVLAGLRGRAGDSAATVIHPASFVSPSAAIGTGAFIGPGAIVHTRARVENHAIINSGAVVEHDCVVGANTHLAPGAVLGGGVRVGTDTLLGLGARVVPGVQIGQGSIVGAGAVVVRPVPDGSTVVGVPASPGSPRRSS